MARGLSRRLLLPLNTAKHKAAFSPKFVPIVRLAVAAQKSACPQNGTAAAICFAAQRPLHGWQKFGFLRTATRWPDKVLYLYSACGRDFALTFAVVILRRSRRILS